MNILKFEIVAQSARSQARVGRLYTAHGVIETPAFMPIGTQASVKTLSQEELEALGYKLILANTYHLYLRPGAERIARLGGLHAFMSWHGAILTDSGGYQVFSLAPLRQINEEGVTFRSHIDGSLHRLTPERAVEVQRLLGSDILMALDECPPYPVEYDVVAQAVERTYRWAIRCKQAWEQPAPTASEGALFGIVQGGVYEELRQMSLQQITSLDLRVCDWWSVGGRACGVDAGSGGVHSSAPPRPSPALSDGCRHARRYSARGCLGRGHVRLCVADATGQAWGGVHLARSAQPAQRPIRRV